MLLFTASYNEKWKCIATLKGDGSTERDSVSKTLNGEPEAPSRIEVPHTTGTMMTRYYKLGQVGHMKYEPTHWFNFFKITYCFKPVYTFVL